MRINPDKCVACGNCPTYVCPMGAIYVDPVLKRATIDRDECVECYTCFNGLSPGAPQSHAGAHGAEDVRRHAYPLRTGAGRLSDRRVRARRADLAARRPPRLLGSRVPHESTGVEGRGTEEVKTNDVTGRVGPGDVGFTIELGRPGVGVRFRDIQEMSRALAAAGVAFEKKNPITSLMSDVPTGTIREDILDEKVLSAIVEIKVPVARAEEIIRLVWAVEKRIDTVVSIGAGVRCDAHGDDTVVAPILERLGYDLARAKTNIGLGRRGDPVGADLQVRPTPRCEPSMTNTLHRFGTAESFDDDFIVFAMACKGPFKQENALEGLRRFLQIAIEYGPVNLGDARHGGAIRPSRQMNPFAHWARDNGPDFQAVVDGLTDVTTCAAVFDDRDKAEQFVKRIKDENLGLSVNVSTSITARRTAARCAGIPRHSVGYSLGFEGKTEKMPNAQVMMLSTMCGHGMISHSLAKKMIDFVKENRRTPEQCAATLTRFCSCGVFNPSRAKRILEDARTKVS